MSEITTNIYLPQRDKLIEALNDTPFAIKVLDILYSVGADIEITEDEKQAMKTYFNLK